MNPQVKGRSLWDDAWDSLRRNRAAMTAIAIMATVVLLVLFAPLLSPYSIDSTDWDRISIGPSAATAHWFGTDDVGRDLFVRTLYGGRISLLVGLAATLVSLVIGIAWGATAGYAGGRIDQLMMRVVDVLYAMPFMFFVILLMVFFGRNIFLIFIAVGAINWLDMARIVRGQTLSLKKKEFIEAARAGGVSPFNIIRRHIVPNLLGVVIVYVTLTIPQVILVESFLSFLGLGVQEPMTSWGALVNDGAQAMETAPWALIFPATFLAVTLFCFNFIGDGLRDALDPRDRSEKTDGEAQSQLQPISVQSVHSETTLQPQSSLLTVSDLNVSYYGERTTVQAVRNLSFALSDGETLGIVGESGSGKTQTALALMGLLPETAEVSGQAIFQQHDLLQLTQPELNRIRGSAMSMIFQDPMTALNPHLTIGKQMARVLERHQGLSRKNAFNEAALMLDAVRVPEARARLQQYPHEMSGGMRQRIMIATALLCRPALLIADEPTTALDVTVQAQILQLMQELQQDLGTALLLITHDMGVVASVCDRVLVMRDGQQRETGPVDQLFYTPGDAYTRELLAAVPRLDANQPQRLAVVGEISAQETSNPCNAQATGPDDKPTASVVLAAEDIHVVFDVGRETLLGPRRYLQAVDGVSFSLRSGETLGIVGESGCGKSTLARAVLQLLDDYTGRVSLLGSDLGGLTAAELKQQRQNMQVVFQDPLASLDPRMTVGDIVGEPLQTFRPELSRADRLAAVQALLVKVGLKAEHVYRYPHEFSGGQCQRIGIARALIIEPELVICDEPVSALDVSVQAQVINLLMDLQQEMGLALVFIAHDLAVVRHISHRVMVMYLGRIVEVADRDTLYESPRHPYTKALISAVPIPDPALERARDRSLLQGDLPSPLDPPSGCAFRTRCPLADERCAAERPVLRPIGSTLAACHHVNLD